MELTVNSYIRGKIRVVGSINARIAAGEKAKMLGSREVTALQDLREVMEETVVEVVARAHLVMYQSNQVLSSKNLISGIILLLIEAQPTFSYKIFLNDTEN